MTPVSGVIFSISIALGVHLTHTQMHLQLHPVLQPLYPWLREQAVLVRLTLPIEWTHALQRHMSHPDSGTIASGSFYTEIHEATRCEYLYAF